MFEQESEMEMPLQWRHLTDSVCTICFLMKRVLALTFFAPLVGFGKWCLPSSWPLFKPQ